MATPSPEYYDPYLGAYYGNILDSYDSSTYRLRLYMINEAAQTNGDTGNPEESRNDTGNATESFVASPGQTVVIADTGGVAGNQIDNLSLTTVGGSGGATTNVTFDIFQPGKSNLLDQIQIAKNILGFDAKSLPPLYLEISFNGRVSDYIDSDENLEGEPELIRGPYRYKMNMNQITANLDESGGTFNFSCTTTESYAYGDVYYRLPQDLTVTGSTVTEMLKSLESELNRVHGNSYKYNDHFEIKTAGVVDDENSWTGPPRLSTTEEKLLIPSSVGDGGEAGTETKNAPLNETPEADGLDLYAEAYDAIRDNLRDVNPETNQLVIKEGTSLSDVVTTILSMCPTYQLMVTRKSQGLNKSSPVTEEDKSKAFTTWCRVNVRSKENYAQWDDERREYAKKITVNPQFYRTARTDVFVDIKENNDLTTEQIESRLNQLRSQDMLLKSYYYLFTGQNDQILNLDLTYDFATSILVAPRDGKVGSLDAAAGGTITGTSVKADPTLEGETADVQGTGVDKDKEKLLDVFGLIGGAINGTGLDQVAVDIISRTTGADPATVSQIIQSGSQQQQEAFLAGQTQEAINKLTRGLNIESQPTQSDNQTEAQANFRFSEDFFAVTPGVEIDINGLEGADFTVSNLDELQRTWQNSIIATKHTEDPVEGSTQIADSESGALFGQLVNQHSAQRFLSVMEMTIRGDPWYLGQSIDNNQQQADENSSIANQEHKKSDRDAGYFGGDDNLFVLEIASPPPRDIYIDDEDDNTGYWEQRIVEYNFTGIFLLTQAVHNFSDGKYSIDISASRLSGIDIAKITPKPFTEN